MSEPATVSEKKLFAVVSCLFVFKTTVNQFERDHRQYDIITTVKLNLINAISVRLAKQLKNRWQQWQQW